MRTPEQSINETLGFDELRAANIERQRVAWPKEQSWMPTHWAIAVAGEVGEACNLIKKMNRGEKIDVVEIAKEIADAQTYLDLLAKSLGIDLAGAVISKFNEVSQRLGCEVRL